jgi:hypothetical protein
MKLAICYSSKNQVELTKQTFARLVATIPDNVDIIWCDGSTDEEALQYFADHKDAAYYAQPGVTGGADAAIAWKLTTALQYTAPRKYTHIMLLENDVLLDEDWFAPTMALFDIGCKAGWEVGAVSPRSYVDRVLFQCDKFAVMFNIGAGAIILTREAAEIILRTFRTGWWNSIRYSFAQVSGIDIGTYACFAGNQQFVTTDWQFEHQLLRRGLCALALTPAKCDMIGQVPSLAEQGLELVADPIRDSTSFPHEKFQYFIKTMNSIRWLTVGCHVDFDAVVQPFHTHAGGTLFFPHQVGYLFAQQQGWRLKWSQGWGPFAYVAGPGGASLSVRVAGGCSLLLSGGTDIGANASIVDTHSGFKALPQLPPFQDNFIEVPVPGGFVPRTIALGLSEGGVFYGVNCADPQMLDASYSFDWAKLPPVE